MKVLISLLCLFAFQCGAQTTTVLISIDGFAAHYLERYQPKNILSLAKEGVSSVGLIPSYPTKTFPNHLTLVTGKVPFEHGIVLNTFYDKKADDLYSYGKSKSDNQWLKYPPIWTFLEQQKVPTAIYFWPESDKDYQGTLPTYFKIYDGEIPNEQRFKQMIEWLKITGDKKPQLIVSYFSTIDSVGHEYGRNSEQLAQAISLIDQQLGDFINEVKTSIDTPVNIILVSDHGMVKTGIENALLKSELIPIWMDKSFKVVLNGTQIFIYDVNNNKKLITKAYQTLANVNQNNTVKRYDVFNKDNYPADWKITKSDSFVPDIIVSAIPPTTFTTNLEKVKAETHGFETKYTDDLNGIFIAKGPDFNSSIKVDTFNNTEVFSILSQIFSLKVKSNAENDHNISDKLLRMKK